MPSQPIGPPVFAAVTGSSETPTVHAKTVAYLLGGLGVAVGGTAIGVYFWNREQYQAAQTEQKDINAAPNQATEFYAKVKFNSDLDSLRSNSILTVGLAVTSVGLLAGSISLYLYERKRDAKAGQAGTSRSWASVTPGGLFWNGVW